MVSSGIRVGAWDYLHWGNIQPVQQEGKVVAARMIEGEAEEANKLTEEKNKSTEQVK
jgi:hypothetical protein